MGLSCKASPQFLQDAYVGIQAGSDSYLLPLVGFPNGAGGPLLREMRANQRHPYYMTINVLEDVEMTITFKSQMTIAL